MISSVKLLGNYIQIKVGHLNCSALCDSGADINVIREQLIRNVACRKLLSDKKFISAVDTEQITILYKVYLPVYIVGHKLNVKFYVVSNLYPNVILGLDFLKNHNITLDFQNKKLYFDPRRQFVLEKGISIPAKR